MKTTLTVLAVLVLYAMLSLQQPGYAQDTSDDPLKESWVIRKGGGDEIIGFTGEVVIVSKIYPAMEFAPVDTVVTVLSYRSKNNWWDLHAFTTLNVNDNGLADIVAAWLLDGGKVELLALRADPNRLSLDSHAEWEMSKYFTKTGPAWLNPTNDPDLFSWWLSNNPRLISADFTGNGLDELVMAYMAKDAGKNMLIHLALLELDKDLELTELASAMDQPVYLPYEGEGFEAYFNIYDVTSADLNGDGKNEILLVSGEAAEADGWNLIASVYQFEAGNTSLTRIRKDTLVTSGGSRNSLINVKATRGYLNNADRQQAVVYYTHLDWTAENYPDTTESYMIAMGYDATFSDITLSAPFLQGIGGSVTYPTTYLFLESGDLNGDGSDEIFSGHSSDYQSPHLFRILKLTPGMELLEYARLDSIYHGNAVMGNLLPGEPGVNKPFDIAFSNYPYTVIYSFGIDQHGFIDEVTPVAKGDWTISNWTTTTGDLDGDIRLGTPRRSSITKILQPLVILNAPPIHFDVFDSEAFDVSRMYFVDPNDPKFTTTYIKETSQSKELETTFNRDWGISSTLSTSHSYFGFSVSAHLTASYGEGFSKVDDSSKTVTVGISVNAAEDDRIYATVMDYDVWEYPVFGNGIERGHVLVVEPVAVENRWFPSKSWSGHSYIPEHEVGNILSYRQYPLLSGNPAVSEIIKGDYNNSFVLDGNSDYNWTLQFDDFQSSGSTTTKEFGMEWGASIGGWGVSLSVNGHYSSEQIRTQRTTVSSGLYINASLLKLNTGLGEVAYRVTPYAYWAKNGALVIDYAVQPELSQPGGTPTWWQRRYGTAPDPGFILPWRYDPEKGFALEDPAKRQQTKDITFFPAEPKAGELVTITANIHNFSLLPTTSPVGVNFYIGDPDENGTLITGHNGANTVYTDAAIPARGRKTVQMQWTVPDNTASFPRIYGVINPGHSLTEIHGNNNKGWSILGVAPVVGIDDAIATKPAAFTLNQNYPNPFNPSTTFEFTMPDAGMADLSVYTILGQKVATVFNGYLHAGTHAHYWHSGGLASGVYLYRLTTGEFVQTRKMLLLK
jgi:hypothetical protein